MVHVESLYINMKFKVWNGPYWQVAMLSLEWSILASCRFLPGFLLPGPISYVERSDSFIVANSAYRPVEYWSILEYFRILIKILNLKLNLTKKCPLFH